MSDVTRILSQLESGDPSAADQLLPLVYQELRRLARRRLADERRGATIQATALVHEAYLRLVDVSHQQRWDSRWHFFSAAAEAMRRIVVENARRKARVKHGGEFQRVELHEALAVNETAGAEVLALDEALSELALEAPDKAELVKLRYFVGMTLEEAAEAMGISSATASRNWTYARTWLFDAISRKRD
jgi:RNA polymerase sigma factor (TIGR02999 family)